MLIELVEKAIELGEKDMLPPIGYAEYKSAPIKLVINIFPDKIPDDWITVTEYFGCDRARPKLSIRKGKKTIPYPLADESGYVLGIKAIKEDVIDDRASEKHKMFKTLLEDMLKSSIITDPLLIEAIDTIKEHITEIKKVVDKSEYSKKLFNKDWVAFTYEKGELEGKYLFEHPQVKIFWSEFVKQNICFTNTNQCSICGTNDYPVKNIPTEIVYRYGSRQLASLNDNAFVSFRYQDKNAPLGICLPCAERASKGLDFLIKKNSKEIFTDKTSQGKINNDSSRNLDAVFWIKEESRVFNGKEEFNPLDPLMMPLKRNNRIQIETTDQLVIDFLQSPWTSQTNALKLNENTFYILILSPNGPGRIAVRDFLQLSAEKIKSNLCNYFQALNLISLKGGKMKPYTIKELLEPLKTTDPNIAKSLVRTAYLRERPTFALLLSAIRKFCIAVTKSDKKEVGKKIEDIPTEEVLQRTGSLIKLFLNINQKEGAHMENLDERRQDSVYQSGVLLAVLEEIQKRAISRDISSTITKRYFGGALTSPKVVLTMLVEMATKAHMPTIERKRRGHKEMEALLEGVISLIDEHGGFPKTLTIEQQGDFILGFYHQRAKFALEFENYLKNKGGNLNGTTSQS